MNEWSPLREIIVGSLKGYEEHVDYNHYNTNKFLNLIYDEVEEGLDNFVSLLEKENVIVHRPRGFCYNVRDCAVVLGDTIVECSMRYRKEYQWLDSLRPIFLESDLNYVIGPKPNYGSYPEWEQKEIIFDGANLVKLDDTVIVAINETANEKGKLWLEKTFPQIKFNSLNLEDNISHIDTTIVPISSDTVLLNSERLNEENLPSYFNDWNKIWIKKEDLIDEGKLFEFQGASPWIGMNILSLNEKTLFVNEKQVKLIEILESRNFNVIPTSLNATRELGGGLHCCTLDLYREF